jgi:hypothetical protein
MYNAIKESFASSIEEHWSKQAILAFERRG